MKQGCLSAGYVRAQRKAMRTERRAPSHHACARTHLVEGGFGRLGRFLDRGGGGRRVVGASGQNVQLRRQLRQLVEQRVILGDNDTSYRSCSTLAMCDEVLVSTGPRDFEECDTASQSPVSCAQLLVPNFSITTNGADCS